MKKILKKLAAEEHQFEEHLLQNYEFYKAAFELSKDPKLVLEDCKIIKFNPITLEFFECDDPHMIFGHILSEFLPDDVKETGYVETKCEGNFMIETEMTTCKGNVLPVTINFDSVSKNGKQRTIATIHDITDRILSKKQLEDSNEFIYNVLENLPIGISVRTIEEKLIKYMNKLFPEIMGWSKKNLANFDNYFEKAFKDVGSSRDIKELVLETLKNEGMHKWENIATFDEDGNKRVLDITMLLMPGQDNMITMVQNVTEEQKNRHWLKIKSKAVYSLPNGIVITDRNGKILWTNPAFEQTYGYSYAETLHQNPRILKSGEHTSEFYTELWNTITAGKTWSGKVINKKKDGTLIEDLQAIVPVRDANAEITHFIAIKNLSVEELDYFAK
jgi:PAS domain S-box-containing protein